MRREYPSDPQLQARHGDAKQRPHTPIQSLMEAPPFEEPEESWDERVPMVEAIDDALGQMPERSAWVIEALFYRGLSLRQLGRELSISKTHIARLRDEALEDMQALLIDNPDIARRLR